MPESSALVPLAGMVRPSFGAVMGCFLPPARPRSVVVVTVRRPRVLVVGGGIAGLAARRALRAEGIDVDVVERASATRPVGTGMFLPGNAARCLRKLGIDHEALLAHGHRIDRQVVTDGMGTLLGEADLAALWGDVGPSVGIHRAALHGLLLGDDEDGIRLGTTVLAVTPGPDQVEVVFGDGSTEAFDLVVGADGVHSAVRTALFPHATVCFGRETYYRTVVDNVVGLDHWAGAWRDDTLLGLVPIGDGSLYCFGAVFGERPHDPEPPVILDFRKHFRGMGDPFGRVVEEVQGDRLLLGPAMTVTADPPVARRVVLIGDAAHANPPSMAQAQPRPWRTPSCSPSCSSATTSPTPCPCSPTAGGRGQPTCATPPPCAPSSRSSRPTSATPSCGHGGP